MVTTSDSGLLENSFRFKVVHEAKSYEDAVLACKELGFVLAYVNSQDQNEALRSFILDLNFLDTEFLWIGVEDKAKDPVADPQTVARFTGVSNKQDVSFFNRPGQYPWIATDQQPDDLGGNQDCVVVHALDDAAGTGFWSDETCDLDLKFVCRDDNIEKKDNNIVDDDILVEAILGLIAGLGVLFALYCCVKYARSSCEGEETKREPAAQTKKKRSSNASYELEPDWMKEP